MRIVARPRPPLYMGSYGKNGQGAWYAGAVPPDGKNAPVLVFVPGLGQTAPTYWKSDFYCGKNEMYNLACAAGYRTAFVTFQPKGAPDADMWQNGSLFARQLEAIKRAFRVPAVTVVAHSKGGVDVETACAYYGAAASVERLVTLSSPHHGSFLADIAYSPSGWHLAEALGVHSDGCYCMQTGYMSEFRRLIDKKPPCPAGLVTLAGRGDGPFLTPLWMGAVALGKYGENDGVVTVASAQNPRGKHAGTLPLNHAQMRDGASVWNVLSEVVQGKPAVSPAMAETEETAAPAQNLGSVLRGGKTDGGVAESLDVESAADEIEFAVRVSGKAEFRLVGPGEKNALAFETKPEPGGSRMLRRAIRNPTPGRWQLVCPPAPGAYMAMLTLYGRPGAPQKLQPGNLRTEIRVLRTYPDRVETFGEFAAGETAPSLKSGFYNMEATLRGELPDGSPFQRTVTKSLLVPRGGTDAADFLPELLRRTKSRRA